MVLRWAFLRRCERIHSCSCSCSCITGIGIPRAADRPDQRQVGSHRVATVTVLLHSLTDRGPNNQPES